MNYQWNLSFELEEQKLAGIQVLQVWRIAKRESRAELFIAHRGIEAEGKGAFFWKSFVIKSNGVVLNLYCV